MRRLCYADDTYLIREKSVDRMNAIKRQIIC